MLIPALRMTHVQKMVLLLMEQISQVVIAILDLEGTSANVSIFKYIQETMFQLKSGNLSSLN